MIRCIFLSITLATILFSSDIFNKYDISYDTLFYNEFDSYDAKKDNALFQNDNSSFGSWFHDATIHYNLTNNIYLTAGAKANILLQYKDFTTDLYKETNTQKHNKSLLSVASLSYDNNFFALTIGRNKIDYDWINGSVDGVFTTIGDDNKSSLRLFWFKNFSQLEYNYKIAINHINANKGIYGVIGKIKKSNFDTTLFSYYMQELRNINGASLNYTQKSYGVSLHYTQAKHSNKAVYTYDESLLQTSASYLFLHNLFTLGGSKTGKNGLLAIAQMGSFITGQFYLANQIDREDALNFYMQYIYAEKKYNIQLLIGATKYNNSFVAIQNNLHSFEADLKFHYNFTKHITGDIAIMKMQVEQRDPISTSELSTTFNLGYHYELF